MASAHSFRSSGPEKEKSGVARTLGRRKWCDVDYFLTIIGLCSILGTVWVGWRYGKVLWSLWQEEKPDNDFRPSSTEWWHGPKVNITILTGASESGAVCLDGSSPAYFLDRGIGEGANNWLVFHEGGGWCENDDKCLQRSYTELGSSRSMPRSALFEGILSSSSTLNPDFHKWNRVLVKYCDGGSFNGDVSEPVEVGLHNNPLINGKASVVFYRGQRVWRAIMEDLMERGMKNAGKALLAGCSAGGLATILHCDQYRDLMPTTTVVKCLSDAGFFIDIPDVSGVQTIAAFYGKVVQLQNMVGNLPKSCTSERDAGRCFFPEYVIPGMRTPFFMFNPAYDSWQFENVLLPRASDSEGTWDSCRMALSLCSDAQFRVVQEFRDNLLRKLQPLLKREKDGAFIYSCYVHCQAKDDSTWNGLRSPKVDGKTVAEVVGDWYFERNSTKVIDCPLPCNPTCSGY